MPSSDTEEDYETRHRPHRTGEASVRHADAERSPPRQSHQQESLNVGRDRKSQAEEEASPGRTRAYHADPAEERHRGQASTSFEAAPSSRPATGQPPPSSRAAWVCSCGARMDQPPPYVCGHAGVPPAFIQHSSMQPPDPWPHLNAAPPSAFPMQPYSNSVGPSQHHPGQQHQPPRPSTVGHVRPPQSQAYPPQFMQPPGSQAARPPPPAAASLVYDDTVQQTIRADPATVQALQWQGHVVLSVADAFGYKMAALQSTLLALLDDRRALLLDQARQLQSRLDEVHSAAARIERETHEHAGRVLGRLAAARAGKLLQLQRDKDGVARDLEAMQRLQQEVAAFAHSQDALGFLARYNGFTEACERLCAKPLGPPASLDKVYADDLEDESQACARLAERHAALGQLLGVKDQIIWQLLQERDQLAARLADLEGARSGSGGDAAATDVAAAPGRDAAAAAAPAARQGLGAGTGASVGAGEAGGRAGQGGALEGPAVPAASNKKQDDHVDDPASSPMIAARHNTEHGRQPWKTTSLQVALS